MKLLSDLDVSGKRVFVRAGIDVDVKELQGGGSVRLEGLKPTVDYLIAHKASKIILAGKIGRPNGKVDQALSTKNLVEPLEKILGQKITFSSQSGNFSTSSVSVNTPGVKEPHIPGVSTDNRIVLLENLHFWPGELEPSLDFAKELASLADIYINEAFPSCHRNEASISLLPTLLPHGAGLRLEEEVKVLGGLLANAEKPFVAIIGGAKIETKIPVIENIAKIADFVLVGGLVAKEYQISNIKYTKAYFQKTEKQKSSDKVIVANLTSDGKDIDAASIEKFCQIIAGAKTIIWNGPVGLFEEGFDKGTLAIVQAIVDSSAYSVVGGGETAEFLEKKGYLNKFSFVSAGGGAMLEFLAGKELPGLVALE